MTEHIQRLRTTVKELEDELHELDSIDDEARDVLRAAMEEIQVALQAASSTPLETHSVSERLNGVARDFESSHPTLAGIINRLIDGLGQMGI
jgi:hypothetical protein